jgi:TolB-like protein/DNA-binding winged helix-turn-helix (wHTH) protein/Tfp pilus assembly protein PilF
MATPSTSPRLRKFGPFAFDPQTGELSRNGRRLRLQPQPAKILGLLTEVPGQLISRDDIRIRVWGADTVADLDQSINFAIRQIRAALDDHADKHQYLETISKRGYRFIAPVSEIDGAREPGSREAEAAPPGILIDGSDALTTPPILPVAESVPARRSFRAATISVVLLAVICLLVIFLAYRQKHASRPPADSIAVLPFVNLTGDPSLEYISDGMTEEMITRLATLDPSRLMVIARTSAMSYKNTQKTAQQIGNELNVQYVVEGSLQKQDGQVRVIAQLIRVSDQMHLWAQTYVGGHDQLPQFENQVAESVAAKLSLPPRNRAQEYLPATEQAYSDYLQGMRSLAQRSKPGFEGALQNFSSAVQQDPKYARAYAQLAVTYNLMGQYNWMRQPEAGSQAKAAAMQALSLDESLSEAHAALGFSAWFYDWNLPRAEREYLRAIALDPNNVDAHHWYAQLLMTSGRNEQSERQMHAALALDPKALILETNLGWIHYTARRYPLAIAEMQQVVSQNPDFLSAHYKLWWTYSVTGDEPHAWQEFQIVVRAISSPEQADKILAAYNSAGYAGSLRALYNADDQNYYGDLIDAARCMMFSGDSKGAMGALQKGLAMHDGWMIFAPTDPAFTSLHSDPQYIHFVSQLNSTSTNAALATSSAPSR